MTFGIESWRRVSVAACPRRTVVRTVGLIACIAGYERVEGRGEPGGSPRSREEGGCTEFAQDRNSLARIPVAELRGETWFPPQTRGGGERRHETTTLALRMTTVCVGCPDASPS